MVYHSPELDPQDTYLFVSIHYESSDASHANLGTTSATVPSYESFVETICTFYQTIDHANHRLTMRRITRKPYKQNFKKNSGCGCGGQQTTHGGRCSEGSGCPEGSGCGSGWRGRSSGHGHNPRCYHNWVPCEQFDNLSNEEYQTLICDRVSQGELQAHNADAEMSALTTPPVGSSVSLPQVPVTTPSTPDASSAITGLPTYPAPNVLPCSVSIALVTPSPSFSGVTTSTQMDSGLNTVLQQLMLNASACTPNTHGSVPPEDPTSAPVCHINHVAYCITTQDHQASYPGTLMDSSANGGMAGFDTCLLATVPHVHVDITGVGSNILQQLPLLQCASVVDTIDKNPLFLSCRNMHTSLIPKLSTRNPKSSISGEWSMILPCPLVDSKW